MEGGRGTVSNRITVGVGLFGLVSVNILCKAIARGESSTDVEETGASTSYGYGLVYIPSVGVDLFVPRQICFSILRD